MYAYKEELVLVLNQAPLFRKQLYSHSFSDIQNRRLPELQSPLGQTSGEGLQMPSNTNAAPISDFHQ